jgi:hypothetical protein
MAEEAVTSEPLSAQEQGNIQGNFVDNVVFIASFALELSFQAGITRPRPW